MEVTKEMIEAGWSALVPTSRHLYFDKAEVETILTAALSVRAKYTREQINEMIGRGEMFVANNSEAEWIAADGLACPHCGGSGHKDDVRALSAQPAVAVPVEPVAAPDDIIEMVEKCVLFSCIADFAGLADHAAFEAGQDNAVANIVKMLKRELAPAATPPAAPQPAQPVDAEDEAYEIGRRDGYSEAVQQIDQLTGGDGEYRYCTDHDPDRHTPGPAEMIQRIVDRFETLNLLRDTEKDGRDQDWGITTPPAAHPFEAVFHGLNEALSVSEVHARMIAAEQRVKALEDENERMKEEAEDMRARSETAEDELSAIAHHLDAEADSNSVLHIIREVQADLSIAADRANAAEARVKALEDALEPFADLASRYDPDDGDDDDRCWQVEASPRLGDLRRARAALNGGE